MYLNKSGKAMAMDPAKCRQGRAEACHNARPSASWPTDRRRTCRLFGARPIHRV